MVREKYTVRDTICDPYLREDINSSSSVLLLLCLFIYNQGKRLNERISVNGVFIVILISLTLLCEFLFYNPLFSLYVCSLVLPPSIGTDRSLPRHLLLYELQVFLIV